MILGYFYLFFSLIHLVAKEFKASKWVDVLDKLIRIRDEEYKDYSVTFLRYLTQTFLLRFRNAFLGGIDGTFFQELRLLHKLCIVKPHFFGFVRHCQNLLKL
jgi:hypothetical protein